MKSKIIPTIRKYCENDRGELVIVQTPNIPLAGWLACTALIWLFPNLPIVNGVRMLGTAFLFTWSYLEITQGESVLRKVFGSVVFGMIVVAFFQ